MSDGSDLQWLGLERRGPGSWTFELAEGLSRLDGKFYGGTGMAVVTAVMEAETARRALWTTVQFVSTGTIGDRFDCRVEVLAEGRRSSQVRVTGWIGEKLVFSGMGATGTPGPAPLDVQFPGVPAVEGPESSPQWTPPAVFAEWVQLRPGWLSITEIRDSSDGSGMWTRLKGRPLTRATMAFLADVIPSAVVAAAGRTGAGTSLDNAMRFGAEPDGDWMLVHIVPHLIEGGYVHGAAHLWSESGRLLGVASQTASLILVD